MYDCTIPSKNVDFLSNSVFRIFGLKLADLEIKTWPPCLFMCQSREQNVYRLMAVVYGQNHGTSTLIHKMK